MILLRRIFPLANLPQSTVSGERGADVCQPDPRQSVSEFLRGIRLLQAKHYLKRRGIKPWDRWKCPTA